MERNAFYDNLKYILITLVLVGHFLGPLIGEFFPLKVFWRWIYMFHMPAFLFVGGMFGKKLFTPEKGLRVNVIAFYLILFWLLYTGLWVEKHLWNPDPTYNLFNMSSIPWYFAAMAAFGISTPIISKIRGGMKTVVPAAIVMAVIAPFNDNFGDFLAIGRIFAYAPFYFAGYFLSISGYSEWVQKCKKMKWPIIAAIAFMVLLYLALYYLPKNITGAMSGLATGHNTYADMGFLPARVDAVIRFADILIAFAMIVALSLVTPTKKTFFSDWGARTLQVYFIHPFIYYPIEPFNLYDGLISYIPWSGFAVIVGAVILTMILAAPPWPEKGFRMLRNAIKIDNNP